MKRLLNVSMLICFGFLANAQDLTKPESTEVWEPEPKIVVPGASYGVPPSDAIVIFDGSSLNNFRDKNGNPITWTLKDGAMTVKPGAGPIWTKQAFNSFQLHIEWRSPDETADKKGQGRGNSGIFLQDRYELQVLNSYQNRTYSNGQAGSIYKQTPPLVNPIRKQGDWNTYDVFYTAPTFRLNGTMATKPYVTVIFNGVIVQNHTEIQGTTEYIGTPRSEKHGDAPIQLQDHSNEVSYRNIWIRPL